MIYIYSNEQQNSDFYAVMGRCFASLDIAKELEQQVYNKDDTVWYVDAHKGNVHGFVSVCNRGKYYFVDNLYVFPEYRDKGLATKLIEEVFTHTDKDKPVRCIACNPYALKIFNSFGFVEVGTNGKYKKLIKH